MQLPKNYFWIPGYVHRYALRFIPDRREFENNVYSFIYPGAKGVPTALRCDDSGMRPLYTLRDFFSNSKDRFTFDEIISSTMAGQPFTSLYGRKITGGAPTIEEDDAFDDSLRSARRRNDADDEFRIRSANFDTAVSTLPKAKGNTSVWMIGTIESNGLIEFTPHSMQYATEKAAYDAAEESAQEFAGTEFVVVKAVRTVKAASVCIVDLI